jgi:hypothetical protein
VLVFGENEEIYILPEILKNAAKNYFFWEKKDLLELLYNGKYERNEYIALILELIEYGKKWKITNSHTLELLKNTFLDLSSTNANARWLMDRVILSL